MEIMIGYGRVHEGLYLLEGGSSISSLKLLIGQALQTTTLEDLSYWHRRLGHLSFGVLDFFLL